MAPTYPTTNVPKLIQLMLNPAADEAVDEEALAPPLEAAPPFEAAPLVSAAPRSAAPVDTAKVGVPWFRLNILGIVAPDVAAEVAAPAAPAVVAAAAALVAVSEYGIERAVGWPMTVVEAWLRAVPEGMRWRLDEETDVWLKMAGAREMV